MPIDTILWKILGFLGIEVSRFQTIKRFIRFGLVGATGVGVDMTVLFFLVDPRMLACGLTLSKALAAETAIVNNFLWNDAWTFGDLSRLQRDRAARLARFYKFNLICLAGIGLSILLLNGQVHYLGWNIYVANAIAIILVSFWNFWMNLKFGWNSKPTVQKPPPIPIDQPQGFKGFVGRHRTVFLCLTVWFSSLLLFPMFLAGIHGDVELYQGVACDLWQGVMPYRDRVLEYPPYAIGVFAIPRFFCSNGDYPQAFMAFAFLAHWAMMGLLYKLGTQESKTGRALRPLFFYCAAIPFISFFFLQRFDIFPALVCVIAVWLCSSGRFGLCGLTTALGIGVKLYPAIFVPALFVVAFRQNKWKQFVLGLTVGLLPIVVLSFYLPWWRFAQFHAARGLQVESIYSSLLWLGKLCGLWEANWVWTKAWMDVTGEPASMVLPWARLIFAGTVVVSSLGAAWAALRLEKPSVTQISKLLLFPLLAFVGFNQVLSPQYMIWILPLAVLTVLDGQPRLGRLIMWATIVTPIIYPSLFGDYGSGLNLFETTVLVLRNLTLVGLWAWLLRWAVLTARKS